MSGALAAAWFALAAGAAPVNAKATYPITRSAQTLRCTVDLSSDRGPVDRRIFGTNLEWFNDAGGLASPDATLRAGLRVLARRQGVTVARYPGGTLADFYHWQDGIGPRAGRPMRRHPTDPGSSRNDFGSPEFFDFLAATGAQGLVTVNVGTGTADEAAAWVAYANRPGDARRVADGIADPVGIHLWEIGNELYLPGNPGEQVITVTPDEYARRYLAFRRAMKAVDPSIETIAIGVARSRAVPDTVYPEWSRILLARAAGDIDMIAVHNGYFPLLDPRRRDAVPAVYRALWAAPEAFERSLVQLERDIAAAPHAQPIGIAVTEWGALFSLPTIDAEWFDHVKTMGSGVYVARMLQVMMAHPSVRVADYFKLADRSFMGWIGYDGRPKVPYEVFSLMAASGDRRLEAAIDGPTYDTPALGVMMAERGVREVTTVATRDTTTGRVFVNWVNRSLTTAYPVECVFRAGRSPAAGRIRSVSAAEPTAHNGRDIPPEWPWQPAQEPYSTAPAGSIGIVERAWKAGDAIVVPPFSVATLVIDGVRNAAP